MNKKDNNQLRLIDIFILIILLPYLTTKSSILLLIISSIYLAIKLVDKIVK